ncbi:classical SDR family protein [Candidatus Planktophila dulcis]|uniref:Classical SDR family protein n=1 Tax=Candidatus Planktophila dulcis TaxID=1884914 RepID=A0AAC9YS61_9ACTN|nr:SDR family oxidoreductase [Candidatus Planktophila dulcis]ASY11455.1 classical SDR family protein [Candidatus Planktophila dulcis]
MKLFSLENNVAVVIGAGGHICSALARGFAESGAKVAVCDLRLEKAVAVAESINSVYPNSADAFEVDASSKDSLLTLLNGVQASLGPIDIALNGAGTNSPKPFLEISTEDWNSIFQTQLIATMLGCQVFGEHMLNKGSGSIINISSASADPGLSKAFAYSAAKAGIRNLTQNLGREWGKSGVRVNAIRPGFFPTEWNRKNFITPERESAILGHTPMGRFGEPDELIGAAVFLASSASNFVTGSELIVDGGFSAMTI